MVLGCSRLAVRAPAVHPACHRGFCSAVNVLNLIYNPPHAARAERLTSINLHGDGKEVNMHTLMKDLTIELGADRPGALAKALEAIAGAGINVDGYAGIGGTLHVLTADAPATRRALEAAGFPVKKEEEVAAVTVADRPGVAATIFRHIADANVNVTFSYVATGNRMIIGASNVRRVAEVLSKEAAVTR